MASRPTPVRSLLRQRLRDLTESADRHAHTGDLVRECLPREAAAHLRGALVDGEALVLYVDSPGWSTRLRFLAPTLLQRLAAGGLVCRHCRVRVQPPGAQVAPVAPTVPPASAGPAAVRAVSSVATTVGSGKLAEALRRLARSLARRQPPA